jgi:hypothetical protein
MKIIKSVRRATIIETGDVLLDFKMADGSTEAFSAPAILIMEMIRKLAAGQPPNDVAAMPVQEKFEVLYNAVQKRILVRFPASEGRTFDMNIGPETAQELARDLLEAAESAEALPKGSH